MIDISTYQELYDLGMTALPVVFDKNKQPVDFPKHGVDRYTINDCKKYIHAHNGVNGIAIKMEPPLGMFDFDLKNTDDKEVYNKWFLSISSLIPDVLSKICIEKTKSNGYHVYFKHDKLKTKQSIAQSKDGAEVIALYTGGLLSFCSPSPGYEIIHNDFNDIDFITDLEFEIFVNCAAILNEYEEKYGDKIVADYPVEYESLCLQFDSKCTDDVFEHIINDIGLFRVKNDNLFKGKKFTPFLRKGSTAAYSAKVYFKSKRLLIMSAMKDYPNFHDRVSSEDHSWVLTPARVIYNKNQRSWAKAIDEIKMICDSAGLDIVDTPPVTDQPIRNEDRMQFPNDIFPVEVQNYIKAQVIQHEYLAGFLLGAISTALGNSVVLQANDGYFVKPILYMAVVAPPGASKSPAMKLAFGKLEKTDSLLYASYAEKKKQYRDDLNEFKNRKKGDSMEEPAQPLLEQMIIKDSTIEMVVKILSTNTGGCCVLADELSGFLKRMGRYGDNDEVQKWLELWSGSSVMLQRVTRDENKVDNPFCSIIGGIQPGVLESLSSEENKHNGFYHRFLFVYPKPQPKNDWALFIIPDHIRSDFNRFFDDLLAVRRDEPTVYELGEDANQLYAEWFNNKNKKYNTAQDDNVKGIIAKYQDYCLRFAVLLQAAREGKYRYCIIERDNMERAIRLTEYFLGNMHKALKVLAPETPIDKLPEHYQALYAAIPASFSTKTYMEIGKGLNIKEGTLKAFLSRGQDSKIFRRSDDGYTKTF